ncbi:MAG: 4-hydroxy-tetrahydrodipicolinate reductase [Propionibacteriaceae bacterium]|nr:4-hydroxy-tetrahydrodipicolinate reductase [Propionibacteriaceae bacterium]
MTRVVVFGADGRMGSEVCQAISETSDLEVVAGVDIDDDLSKLPMADLAIDFTHPDAVMGNIEWCIGRGLNCVVGTTGFNPERIDQVKQWLSNRADVGVLIAPNFAIGAVLTMYFASVAAPYFEAVEIIEAHHLGKADAPSGTAVSTAERVAAARAQAGCSPVPEATSHSLAGARGADVLGVPVHALRLPGVVAQEEVRLASAGETLTIINDARARSSYMPGVIAAARWIGHHSGLTVGLDSVLGLPMEGV